MTDSRNVLSQQWLQAERAALARAHGKQKLDIILDASDPQALVRSLPAEDLFFAVQEIGKADASPLVQLASPEQFRTFVDLDAWRGETFDPHEMLLWLRLARGDDDVAYREKLAGLDVEVVELLLRGIVGIYDLEEDGEPGDDIDGTIERTPEGRFMLVYDAEGAEYAAARRVIDDLYADDPFRAGRILYAVRWELESELSESAWRWRNARLADLGFPSPEEAASLYARVDRKAPLPPHAGLPETEPGFFLAGLEAGSLLDRAMALVPDEDRNALQLQVVAVLNAALVADRIEVADLDAVREHAEAVRATIALGLADLAGGDDAQRAAEILARTATRRIFQVGFTRTLELKWRAERLVKELPVRLPRALQPLPDEPEGEAIAALLLRRPRTFGGLEGPQAKARVRPFATLADVEQASTMLDRVEAIARAFAAAGLDREAAAARVIEAWGDAGLARARWSDLWATAVAREAVGAGFAIEPLPREALASFLRQAFDEDGRLTTSFREAAMESWLARAGEAAGDHARRFADGALARLESELGAQVAAEGADEVDARYAAPLIVPAASNVVRLG